MPLMTPLPKTIPTVPIDCWTSVSPCEPGTPQAEQADLEAAIEAHFRVIGMSAPNPALVATSTPSRTPARASYWRSWRTCNACPPTSRSPKTSAPRSMKEKPRSTSSSSGWSTSPHSPERHPARLELRRPHAVAHRLRQPGQIGANFTNQIPQKDKSDQKANVRQLRVPTPTWRSFGFARPNIWLDHLKVTWNLARSVIMPPRVTADLEVRLGHDGADAGVSGVGSARAGCGVTGHQG